MIAPTATPTVIVPAIPVATVAPTATATVPPREQRELEPSPREQLRGISFSAYGRASFTAIRNASTPQEAARLALNFYSMKQQAQSAANQAPTQDEVSMWNNAEGLFGALADAANHQRDYLDGQMLPGLLPTYEDASEKLIEMHAQMADNLKPPGL